MQRWAVCTRGVFGFDMEAAKEIGNRLDGRERGMKRGDAIAVCGTGESQRERRVKQ
jgi:hypothetical protein